MENNDSCAIFDVKTFDVAKFDSILAKGLSAGLGDPSKQVCIEAAICQTLGLPHGDNPPCVSHAVRSFKIALNDSKWSSAKARAEGLHDLGLAQLGSAGVVDDNQFTNLLVEKAIRVLLPILVRELFPDKQEILDAALVCENEGSRQSANSLASLLNAAYVANANAYAYAAAAKAATYAATAYTAAKAAKTANAVYATAAKGYTAAAAANVAYAAYAATYADNAVNAKSNSDKYLKFSASLALETLRELKSPGVELLGK